MSETKAAEGTTLKGGKEVVASLVIAPIGEMVTPAVESGPARGKDMHAITRIRNAAIAVCNGKIVYAGPLDGMKVATNGETKEIDASHKVVSPGLVDPHTHTVFAGNRANEFIMRCQGKSYSEIASAGGGIVASMRATQNAKLEELLESGKKRLQRTVEHGCTTLEIKTGYGLSADSEATMLEAILQLGRLEHCCVVPTFMPAHAVPPNTTRESYVSEIVSDMLPRARAICDRWTEETQRPLPPVFVDVFCDQGYFTLEDTRRIFDAARDLGFKLKVHADEFVSLGATSLAAEYEAASADHLLAITDEEIQRLGQSNTVAVLLPGTSFYLNLSTHAPARKMIDKNVAVALGSDFNPGSCHIFSLPLIWGLACLHLKLTPEEALTALTLNAAHAVGMGKDTGMLRQRYRADITIYDVASLEEIPYNLGWNPVDTVIKDGVIVVADKKLC